MFVLILILYFLSLAFIGLGLAKKNIDFDTFFFAKRKLGSSLIFITVTASWFGAASTIATIGAGRTNGYNALWLLAIPTVLSLIFFIVVQKRIYRSNFQSLPQFLKSFYTPRVALFAAALIYLYMILLAASQFVAWGRFISHFLGKSYSTTILIGALIVIFYSYLGGYLSVVFTDGIQFLLLTAALVFLFCHLRPISPHLVPADMNMVKGIGGNLLITLSFFMAWTISPIIWQRIASAGSEKKSRGGLVLAAATVAFLYLLTINIAIGLRQYGHQDFSAIVKGFLSPGGKILVFIGIAAAIMSTADTAINVAALTLVKDVVKARKERVIQWSRFSTLISGILAVTIALSFDSIILVLGLASQIMAQGFFIPGMAALFWKKQKQKAGTLSILLGGGFSILAFVNTYGLNLPIPAWPHSLPIGIALSLAGFLIGLVWDHKH
jgi:SSS family solute:Na+ symporter